MGRVFLLCSCCFPWLPSCFFVVCMRKGRLIEMRLQIFIDALYVSIVGPILRIGYFLVMW